MFFGPRTYPSRDSSDALEGKKYTNNLSSADKGSIVKQSPHEIVNKVHDSAKDNETIRKKLEIISQYHHYNNVLIYETKTALHKMLIDLYNSDLVTIPALNDDFKENLIILSQQKDNVSTDIVALKNVDNFYERFVKNEGNLKMLTKIKNSKQYKKSKNNKTTRYGKPITTEEDLENLEDDEDNDEYSLANIKEQKNQIKYNTTDPKSLFDNRISPYVIVTLSPEKFGKYCDYMHNNKVKQSKDTTLYQHTESHGFMFKIVVSLNNESEDVRGEDNLEKLLESIRNFGKFCERQQPMFLRWGVSKPHYSVSSYVPEPRDDASVTVMTRNRKIINAIKLYGFKKATLSVADNSYIESNEEFDEIFS